MIKTPLLISLAAAAILTGNLQADTFNDETKITPLMTLASADNEDAKAVTAKDDDATAEDEDEADEAVTDEDDDAVDEDDEADDEEADADEDDDEDDAEDEDISTAAEMEDQLTELNKRTSGNHLKLGVDFRTAVDNLQYKMADGSKQKNNALLTNRLWLNMNWAATKNLSFTGQLAYNKAYGARSGYSGQIAGMEDFDWIVAENPHDGALRVRSAYFFYRNNTFLGTDIPWTFSIGRRPSTNGHLINLRDDDASASPLGHSINVEFDGLSAKFSVWEDIGMYFKFCAGRGGSNASPRFFAVAPSNGQVSVAAPYATNKDDIPDIDLGGLIFVPYDDGQYSIATQYYYAANLIDAAPFAPVTQDPTKPPSPTNPVVGQAFQGMETVGDMQSITANITISGIGDEWSDFLDDTLFFVSGAMSITKPDSGKNMLGSTDSERGYSYWVGLQFPSLISEEGRWGLEYNHGSKYWRSVTYGEDTLAGSKMSVRGNAYEAYFTEPLIDNAFSFQLRYTYLDYKYTGSNGFFGGTTGAPEEISKLTSSGDPALMGLATVSVDTAQDIRAYLRYRF